MIHVGRNPESIVTRDGDLVLMLQDRLIAAMEDEITVKSIDDSGDDSEDSVIAKVITENLPSANDRIFLYSRLTSSMKVANSFRAALWFTGENEAEESEVDAHVLREVINPRINYDTTSNIIHLWFWTNFKQVPEENIYTDDAAYLYRIDEDSFSEGSTVYRAICYTMGTFQYGYIENGWANGDPDDLDVNDNGYDIIPLFKRPKIAQWRKINNIPILDFAGTGGGGSCRIPYYVS